MLTTTRERNAGRELDAEVHRLVFATPVIEGWPCWQSGDDGLWRAIQESDPEGMEHADGRHPVFVADDSGWLQPVPNYSTDIAEAQAVIEKLTDYDVTLNRIRPDQRRPGADDAPEWECCFYSDYWRDESADVVRVAETPALAICLAALALVGEDG